MDYQSERRVAQDLHSYRAIFRDPDTGMTPVHEEEGIPGLATDEGAARLLARDIYLKSGEPDFKVAASSLHSKLQNCEKKLELIVAQRGIDPDAPKNLLQAMVPRQERQPRIVIFHGDIYRLFPLPHSHRWVAIRAHIVRLP